MGKGITNKVYTLITILIVRFQLENKFLNNIDMWKMNIKMHQNDQTTFSFTSLVFFYCFKGTYILYHLIYDILPYFFIPSHFFHFSSLPTVQQLVQQSNYSISPTVQNMVCIPRNYFHNFLCHNLMLRKFYCLQNVLGSQGT